MSERIKQLKEELRRERQIEKVRRRTQCQTSHSGWFKKAGNWTEGKLLKICESFERQAYELRLKRSYPNLYNQMLVLEDIKDTVEKYELKFSKHGELSSRNICVVEALYSAAGAIKDECSDRLEQDMPDEYERELVICNHDNAAHWMERLRMLFPDPEAVSLIESTLDDIQDPQDLLNALEVIKQFQNKNQELNTEE
jgi:hypothetical protein